LSPENIIITVIPWLYRKDFRSLHGVNRIRSDATNKLALCHQCEVKAIQELHETNQTEC
jgi:hypothetical protein